jgi:hypothetical protein
MGTEPLDLPQRIQLRRTKDWRKPEGAIVVARGRQNRWGNPYRIDDYRADYPDSDDRELRLMAVSDFRGMLEGKWGEEHEYPTLSVVQAELVGHDLACWCPLDQPCHADVLLELANPGD